MNSAFRTLTEQEHKAFEMMLAVAFGEHQRLKGQVFGLFLRPIYETVFELAPQRLETRPALNSVRKFALPIECTYADKDGAIVYVDLFVDECDALVELELWKPDGRTVQTYFADADLVVELQSV